MDVSYTVIKRKIKNPRLEFKLGKFQVVIPVGSDFDIPAFLNRHQRWIKKHLADFNLLTAQAQNLRLQPRLFAEFEIDVKNIIETHSQRLGVSPKAIKYKTMRARWGSCSSAGVITLNLKLRYFSTELIGYVVFHEMVHLLEKNHGQRFYKLLSSIFPEYRQFDKELRAYDYLLHQNTYK